ncbi:MAG: DUF4124 domain-containing protein [Caldimonas sp.]
MTSMRNVWRSRLLFGIVALSGACLSMNWAEAAEVFKCKAPSGQVEFTDAPCGRTQTSAVVDARPNSLDYSAVREQLLKIENRSLQDKLAATSAAQAASLQGQPDFARSDTPACRSARRDADIAATSVENNKALIRTRLSVMNIACGVREPDKQITNINVGRGERSHVDPRTSTR